MSSHPVVGRPAIDDVTDTASARPQEPRYDLSLASSALSRAGTAPSTPLLLLRTVAAEWLRLRTVRSTWLVVATATLGILYTLVLLALAAASPTADFGTGGIVPTLQWTPRRGVLLAARTAVIVAFTVALGLLIALLAGVVISGLVPAVGLPWDEGRQMLGAIATVYAFGAGIAVGLGLLLRNTVGAVVSVLGLMIVLPGITTTSARLDLAAWAAGSLLLGGWRLLRSDANR